VISPASRWPASSCLRATARADATTARSAAPTGRAQDGFHRYDTAATTVATAVPEQPPNSARDIGDDRSRLRRRGVPHVLHVEVEVAVPDADDDPLAAAQPAVEQQPGEPVVHLALDGPAQRPGAELGLVAPFGEPADRLRGELDVDAWARSRRRVSSELSGPNYTTSRDVTARRPVER
jgi:hypothetical protein